MSNFLSGIKTVHFSPSKYVRIESNEIHAGSIPVDVVGKFTLIDICELASVEIEDKIVSGQNIYRTVLRFMADNTGINLSLKQLLTSADHVFLLSDVVGKVYLLGNTSKPHPIVTSKQLNSNDPKDANIMHFEVSYENVNSLLRVDKIVG